MFAERLGTECLKVAAASLVLSGCIFAGHAPDASAIGTMDGLAVGSVVRGEVLDKRDGSTSAEEVTIRLDGEPVDLRSSRDGQVSLQLNPGDELVLVYSEGNYKVGRSYAFFVVDTPEQSLALYGHDLDSDEPAKEFDDNEGYANVKPIDVLDCLVESQRNEGDLPRLQAASQAIRDSNELGVMSPALRSCEFPDE